MTALLRDTLLLLVGLPAAAWGLTWGAWALVGVR